MNGAVPLNRTSNTVAARACFHCGEEITQASRWTLTIDGVEQSLCCAGCMAVAEAIVQHGLQAFYRQRTTDIPRLPAMNADDYARLAALDQPEVQAGFAVDHADGRTASLLIGNLNCVACAWLVETRLTQIPGVVSCAVNYTARRAEIAWRPHAIRLSEIIAAARELGFDVAPFDPARANSLLETEFLTLFRRFGLAALCAMQVMMIATALYFDDEPRAARQYGNVLDWVSFGFTLPVLLYCAVPFMRGTRRALRLGTVTMEVPIVLGLTLAFAGSLWALWSGEGEVYFDSITMFVTLLLGSRLLELNAERRAARYLESLYRIEPVQVVRIKQRESGRHEETVLASELKVGDVVRLPPGGMIPIDGMVCAGASTVDERVLTGESLPCCKRTHSQVVSGSTNIESPLEVEVTAIGRDTVIAQIARLAAHAAALPSHATRTEALAKHFVWLVLALAGTTIIVHTVWFRDAWLAPTIAVLVISCPCALALAMPTAVHAARATLLQRGVLVLQLDALRTLAGVHSVVFDKTGTLTRGILSLSAVRVYRPSSPADPLALAAALARASPHPIASALAAAYHGESPVLTAAAHRVGLGVTGSVDGARYALGSLPYLAEVFASIITPSDVALTRDKLCYLADAEGIIARFTFADAVRPEAAAVIDYFKRCGVQPTIMSGDHAEAVNALAQSLGVLDARAAYTPAAKLAAVASMTEIREGVAAVGDGINDAPMLARADVAITLGAATVYAKENADIILLESGLDGLVTAHRVARRMTAIGRQNQWWAVAYNLTALPLALAGIIVPWVAALLMAGSSLFVVANATRVARAV
ncbi:MAG: cadmium-translocating P-type ATPase [Gammaproteobacteria bacterium]|nr:cadmium-translocating P-type ATPase [Gammaproteobacteria bacterium]